MFLRVVPIIIALCGLTAPMLVVTRSAHAFDLAPVFSATWEKEIGLLFCAGQEYNLVSTNGTFEVGFDPTDCDSDLRGVLEFDLAGLSSPVGTVILVVVPVSGSSGVDIHGFAGNGTVEVSDPNVDNQIATLPGAAAGSPAMVDVSAFVDSLLVAGATHAGFMFEDEFASSTRFVGTGSPSAPQLTNEFPPVADAGPDQTTGINVQVTLDGSLSSDPDGDLPLSFSWSLVAPGGSTATLDDPSSMTPSFVADRAGGYTAELIVTDAVASVSGPDEVVIDVEGEAQIGAVFAATWEKEFSTALTCAGDTTFDRLLSSGGSFEAGREFVDCDSDRRGVLEFDLSLLPDEDLEIVHLVLQRSSGSSNPVRLHGYAGDGLIGSEDANVDSFVESINFGPSFYSFDVTDFVRDLVANGESHAGFTIEGNTSASAIYGGTSSSIEARLHVVSTPLAAVPGLGPWAGIAAAGAALAVAGRSIQARRRRSDADTKP